MTPRRPTLHVREVARLTGDTLAHVEELRRAGTLGGPFAGLVWVEDFERVYAKPTGQAVALRGRAERVLTSLGRRA